VPILIGSREWPSPPHAERDARKASRPAVPPRRADDRTPGRGCRRARNAVPVARDNDEQRSSLLTAPERQITSLQQQ